MKLSLAASSGRSAARARRARASSAPHSFTAISRVIFASSPSRYSVSASGGTPEDEADSGRALLARKARRGDGKNGHHKQRRDYERAARVLFLVHIQPPACVMRPV